MVGDSAKGKSGKEYRYYTCYGKKHSSCSMPRVRKDAIEDAVVSILLDIIRQEDNINAIADAYMEWQDSTPDESDSLKARLSEVEKAISNTIKAIDSGVISQTLLYHLSDLEEQRSEISLAIEKAAFDSTKVQRELIVEFLRSFNGVPQDAMWRITLVDTFLESATVFRTEDGFHIRCKINYGIESEECSDLAPSTPPDCAKTKLLIIGCSVFAEKRLWV